MVDVITTDTGVFFPSRDRPGYWYWSVYPSAQSWKRSRIRGVRPQLAQGYASSYEQAFRNARNYIRNNQDVVYP